jgi:hypothetical protein
VRTLTLLKSELNAEELRVLSEFKHLKVLRAGIENLMAAAGFLEVRDLKNLCTLELFTPKTDAELNALKEFKDIQAMRLIGTQITDRGMKELQTALLGLQIERYP